MLLTTIAEGGVVCIDVPTGTGHRVEKVKEEAVM
jgi:hypothetical protein